MSFFIGVLAATLDPIKLVVVIGCFMIYFNRYTIPFAVLISACISEALLVQSQAYRTFGDGILIQLFGAVIVTIIVYFAWVKIKNIKKRYTAE